MPPWKMISAISVFIFRLTSLFIAQFILLSSGPTILDTAIADGIRMPLAQPQQLISAEFSEEWIWDEGRVRPIAIDIHPSGIITCIEARRHRLGLITAEGVYLGYGDPGGGDFGFADKIFSRFGLQLYTLDTEGRAIDYFDLRGGWQGRLDLEEAAAGAGEELSEITDFCLDPGGDLLVLEGDSGRILRFDRFGTLVSTIGQWGSLAPSEATAIEIDGHGWLYLLESEPPGLLVLETDGHVIGHYPLNDLRGREIQPTALAVDKWGNAFVADSRSGEISILPFALLGADSKIESQPPSTKSIPTWIQSPPEIEMSIDDLAVDDGGRLLVADARHARVWVFTLTYETTRAKAFESREEE